MADAPSAPTGQSPTVRDALHTTVDVPFEDAVLEVQLEHELAGFETVAVSRLDKLVLGALGDEVGRTAMVVVCHAEIARDAVRIGQTLAGLLPCTTVVYEDDEGVVHVHHTSATKAIRDLGCAAEDPERRAAIEDLVETTGAVMAEVWSGIERIGRRGGSDGSVDEAGDARDGDVDPR